jgi:hypothetical protein
MTVYTLRRGFETQCVVVCDTHAMEMPQVDQDIVDAYPADEDCACEFCPR